MATNNSDSPLISVVMPVFNGQTHLRESIETVFKQDYKYVQLIVVDDGSTDDTSAILDRYKDRAMIIRQANAGPGAARNNGIRHADGELIAFLDADDLWPTDNLTRHVEVFRTHPHFEVVVGQVQCLRAITPANAATKIRRNIDDDMPNSYLDHELSVSFYSYLFGAAVVKPHVFQTAGWIDELNYFGEDVDWFFRVRESQVVLCQTEHVALHYRRHAESITRVNPINPMLRVLKESLDRRRGSSDSNVQASPIPPAIVSTQAGARQP